VEKGKEWERKELNKGKGGVEDGVKRLFLHFSFAIEKALVRPTRHRHQRNGEGTLWEEGRERGEQKKTGRLEK